jgi:hypothetical protein
VCMPDSSRASGSCVAVAAGALAAAQAKAQTSAARHGTGIDRTDPVGGGRIAQQDVMTCPS